MTRLTQDDIANIPYIWKEYEEEVQKYTQASLFELSCLALDLCEKDKDCAEIKKLCSQTSLAVIPLNQGEGQIEGFSLALKSIGEHLSFKTEIFPADEEGFSLYKKRAEGLCIWASDEEFFAESALYKSDNNIYTGKGFAEFLHRMLLKDNKDSSILIRGCGPIGTHAARHFLKRGRDITLYDRDESKAQALLARLKEEEKATNHIKSKARICALSEKELKASIQEYTILFDAAPFCAQKTWLGTHTFEYVVGPCVPFNWRTKVEKAWNDPLQLGSSLMLLACCAR